MKKIASLGVATFFGLMMTSTTALANPNEGQKIYQKFFKASCGMSGAKFANMKNIDSWTMVSLKRAIINKCKNPDMTKVNQDLLDFMKEYAADSGNIPSC